MNMLIRAARFRVLVALAAIVACAPLGHAQSPTWSNTGTSFNLGANWSSGAVPTSIANFDNTAVFQPNLATTVSIQRLTFLSAASGYSLTASPGAQFNLANVPLLTSSATSGFNTVSAPINLTGAASGTQTVTVSGAAPLVWNGPITATNAGVLIAKQGSGTLFMGSNSYAGPFGFDGSNAAGTIVVDSIRNVGGGASSLGAPTTAASGTIRIVNSTGGVAARLRYVGGTTSTDRGISFETQNAAGNFGFMLQASGAGPLTWAGNLNSSGTSNRVVWLSGISEAANTFSGVIANGVSGTTTLMKNGAGNWTLTGANTYAGQTYINGGTLTVDYQQGGSLPSGGLTFGHTNGSNLGFASPTGGGTLRLVAKSSGATTQTVGNLNQLTGASPSIGGQSRIELDPNGGTGITLTTGTWAIGSSNMLVLDLPTGATLTPSTGLTLTNSLVTSGQVVVQDSSGIGFATVSGGNVVRFTGASQLTATTNNFNSNFSLAGSLTFTGATVSANTLSIDTTGGGVLNLNGKNFATRAILFAGSGDYQITTGTVSPTLSPFFHQHSTGVVTIDSAGATTTALYKGGAGTLALTTRGGSGALGIYEGALRANGATVYSAGNTVLGGGGVLELGAAGTFTGATGTAAGQIRWIGDGGFSAFGAERTVQIGGNTNTLTWGATDFVPDDNALVLSNVKSDNTVNFQNGLDFGTQPRLVRVANGSAAIDAKLSGVLSGNYGGGLYKTGAGTLELTAANTYRGETSINAGTLRVSGGGSINQSQRVLVNNASAQLNYNSSTALTAPLQVTAGTISGTGSISASGGVSIGTGAILSPGNSPGIQAYTTLHAWAPGGTYKWELNALTGSPGTNWDLVNVTSGTFSLGELADAPGSRFLLDLTTLGVGDVAGQLVNPYDGGSYTFAIASYSLANVLLPTGFSNTAGADLTGLFQINLGNWQGTQPQAGNISVKINSAANGIDLVIVPEPGTLALAGIGIAAAGYAARRRHFRKARSAR
jgi:autotransporter-associated beta strand protein